MLLKAIASSPPTSLSASTSNFKGCLGVNSKNMIFVITNNKTFDHQMFFGQEDGKLIFVGKGVLERITIIASEARSRNDGSLFFFGINTSGEMLNPVLTCVCLTTWGLGDTFDCFSPCLPFFRRMNEMLQIRLKNGSRSLPASGDLTSTLNHCPGSRPK